MDVPPKLNMTNIIFSISQGQDPDTPTYMEALSGREDFPCEDFQRATNEYLVLWKRN